VQLADEVSAHPQVPPAGFEPAISALKGLRPGPLDDGGVFLSLKEKSRSLVGNDPWAGSGEWIRTTDLRVMSPTSYHCSTPRRVQAKYTRSAAGVSRSGGDRMALAPAYFPRA
jgi:hypothetical protein